MNKINNRTTGTKLLALLLVVVMMVSLMPMAVFAGLFSVSAQAADDDSYRIVMLDCGRKYFSVENIEKLIDKMAQYGYNQLTLAFGNGGCRFLLNDMSLSFDGGSMTSDTVKNNITAGNNEFNSDTRYLSQSNMDTIIAYAKEKNIEIVPLLNMPGHADAILYNNTSYTSNGNLNVNDETSRNYGYALLGKYVNYFADKGCKYFHFGADESGFSGTGMSAFLAGCADVITKAGMTPRMFNDPADGTNTIPTGVEITYWYQNGHQSASTLANNGYSLINTHGRWYYVIKSAQNSEINEKYWQGTVNTTATSVELPVMKQNSWGWIDINTFYDSSNSKVTGNKGTMFCIWCDKSEDAYLTDSDVISENENYGALYQLEKLAEHYWSDDIETSNTIKDDTTGVIVEFPASVNSMNVSSTTVSALADANYVAYSITPDSGYTSGTEVTVTLPLGELKDLDASQLTGFHVKDGDVETIKGTKNNDGTYTFTTTLSDVGVMLVDANTQNVTLNVVDSKTFENVTGEAGSYITDSNKYIATAEVETSTATTADINQSVTSITSGSKYLILPYTPSGKVVTSNTSWGYNGDWTSAQGLLIQSVTINNTNIDNLKQYAWTITKNGDKYTVQNSAGKYMNIVSTKSLTLSDTEVSLNLGWSNGKVHFSNDSGCYLNNFGGGNTFASAYTETLGDNDLWTLYEIVEESTGGSTLTITGTGEGKTSVTVGDTTYIITVTAPTEEKNQTLTYGGDFTPTGTDVTITSGDDIVSLSDGKIVAGSTDGKATVTSVVKNDGGNVTARYTYTVNVTTINFDDIADLNVQLWITNTWVGENEAPTSLQTVNIKAKNAYGKEGVRFKNLVPEEGYKKDSSSTVKVTYWKGALLGTEPTQQGTDLSGSGFDFTYIRYWNGNWEYSPDGKDWDSYKSHDSTYVIAYYLQINNVSPEIITGTKDYGNPPTSDPGNDSTNGFTMTAFAVVYPDGTLSRTEQQMYETGMMRGFWGSTEFGIGLVFAENNSTYKISKMTVTWGTNITKNLYSTGWYTDSQNGTYGTDWGVKWNKVTNSAGDEWYDETTYWEADNDKYSSIPMINGDDYDLKFNINDHHAVLILIYLETVETDDSLEVIYWDDSANTQIEANDVFIDVTNGTTFYNGLKQTSSVPTEGSGHFTLDSDAYVTNKSGVTQGFNTVISTVPGVSGVYLSGMYNFKDAHIRDDGKTLVLHYTLSTPSKEITYVVDFGLPLVINFKDALGLSTANIASVSLEAGASTTEKQGTYGYAKISNKDTVTYTLNKVITGVKLTIPLYIKLEGYQSASLYQIQIIPASTVYYEDSFVTTTDGEGSAIGAEWGPAYDDDDESSAKNLNQALTELGKSGNTVYGYDDAYKNGTQFSMGSANKVTVKADMNTGWTDESKWPTATFTFKGTGFDLISLTDNNSGLITYRVKGKDTGYDKTYFVNNYYGYEYKDGEWVVTTEKGANALYQIPVVKVDGLTYDEYTVTITVAYENYFDKTGDSEYSFWLDGVRVYNTLDDSSIYAVDGEAYPQFFELRNEIVDSESSTFNGVLFIDGTTNATLEQYTNYGPNHEIYLAENQSIVFQLSGDISSIDSVQLGAKAVNGDVEYAINNGNEISLATATDLYYDITASAITDGEAKTVTITNKGTNILSLTTLKVTFKESGKSVSIGISSQDVEPVLLSVRAMFAMPVEPETFEPETFKASFSPVIVKEGKTATLTVTASEEVEAILVDGEEVDSYRTRTVTTGWGSNRTTVTYHVFTYTVTATETADYSIVAVNADGAVSEEITATLTVWQGFGNWFKDIIGRFF